MELDPQLGAAEWKAAAALVARILGGEPAAEEELVLRYGRGVTLILKRHCEDPSAAEDLYQETFRLALEKIRRGAVESPERLSGFVAGLARNLAIDHFRRLRRREGSRPVSEHDGPAAAEPPAALEGLLARERADLARRVLADLPARRDREILWRFYVAEDDKQAICADLGLSALHFNRVLYRARERYRELLERAGLTKGGTIR
jgi:RNA polymerase sigma-70 factor (ECF subfamily)